MRALFLLLLSFPLVAGADDGGVPRPGRTVESLRLLYFHAPGCGSCRRFEAANGPRRIVERLPALKLVRVEVTDDEALVTKLGVEVTPTLVLVDAEGFPLGRPRIDLDDPDATAARVVKLVEKMTKGRVTGSP